MNTYGWELAQPGVILKFRPVNQKPNVVLVVVVVAVVVVVVVVVVVLVLIAL